MTFVPYLIFCVVKVGKEIVIAHYATQASKILVGEEKNRSIINAIQITNSNYFFTIKILKQPNGSYIPHNDNHTPSVKYECTPYNPNEYGI